MTFPPIMILPLVVLAIFVVSFSLILWAGAVGWKPRPLRPWTACTAIVAAVVAAGGACAYYAQDIRVLGWWIFSLVLLVILLPPILVVTSLCLRLALMAISAILRKYCSRK